MCAENANARRRRRRIRQERLGPKFHQRRTDYVDICFCSMDNSFTLLFYSFVHLSLTRCRLSHFLHFHFIFHVSKDINRNHHNRYSVV